MSDSDEGDSYHEEGFPSLQCDHEEGFPSLQCDEGSVDSLPDLVLSAATTLSQTTQVELPTLSSSGVSQELLDQLDLTGSLDVTTDFDYSVPGEQVG